MLEGVPDAISASAYGLGSDRVRGKPSVSYLSTRTLGAGQAPTTRMMSKARCAWPVALAPRMLRKVEQFPGVMLGKRPPRRETR